MYKWVEEVDTLVKNLKGKENNTSTRKEITKKIINVLNKHKVIARVDCSPRYNDSLVIDHGEFRAYVETKNLEILFKYVKEAT